MRLSILHITARADHSGGPRHVYDAVRGLRARADVFVACPREPPFWDRYVGLVGSERVYEIPHRRLSLAALASLGALVRREKIGIVHSHGRGAGFYGRLLARLTNGQSVHSFHGLHTNAGWRGREERWLARGSAALVAVSISEADRARTLGAEVAAKVVLIPNGVDIPLALQAMSGMILQVVGIMRLDAEKSPSLFVEICRRLPEIAGLRYRVLGGGPLLQSLRGCSAVEFVGAVDEPRDFLTNDSIYLATSKGEGLSLAMLDAMAAGVPVVVSAVPGHTDLIQDDVNGLLFPYGDAARAAEQILRLVQDEELRQRLRHAAWKTVNESHRVEQMIERLLKLYERIQPLSPLAL